MIVDSNYIKAMAANFSLIVADERKVPIGAWKDAQTKARPANKVIDLANNSRAHYIGIVTGYEGLEVIDVDLKVLGTTEEKKEFWDNLYKVLYNIVYDLESKIVVYKTVSDGVHILYKTNVKMGNTKLATLKGHKSAIIETRGVGGYVVAYKDRELIPNRTYFDIDFITDEERNAIVNVCRSFNYEVPVAVEPTQEAMKDYASGLTPWDDFNNQNTVWDVVSEDFTIIKNINGKLFVKRHGAESAYSGYIYTNDNRMYIYSTGTIYPHEKQISPYAAYVYRYHAGDFSAAAKDLYQQGFGDRIVRAQPTNYTPMVIDEDSISFPLAVFPEPFRIYIVECADKLGLTIDYMGCTLLWVYSIIIGNLYEVEIKKGWTETACLWIALVGRAGIGKTPSISQMAFPIEKINNKGIKKYYAKLDEWNEWDKLTKKEKEQVPEPEKPNKTQFIVNDITLEALIDLMQDSDTGIGVYKDELAGWFKDMNKYRDGSDLEAWLSIWSSKSVNVNRMTRRGSFVSKPFISVIGGIQPDVFNSFDTEENKSNGFLDRILLCYPDKDVEEFNENELTEETIQWYSELMTNVLNDYKTNHVVRDVDGDIDAQTVRFSKDAKDIWIESFNAITALQNDDNESDYIKAVMPKMKAYIARMALIIHLMYCTYDGAKNRLLIDESSVHKSIELYNYFLNMSKKVKNNIDETREIKRIKSNGSKKSIPELISDIFRDNPAAPVAKVASILGCSRQNIYTHLKKKNNESKPKN